MQCLMKWIIPRVSTSRKNPNDIQSFFILLKNQIVISLMTLPLSTCLSDNPWLWLVGKYWREREIQIYTSMTAISTTLYLRVYMHYVIWFSFKSINTSWKVVWIKSWVPFTDFRFFTVLYFLHIFFYYL